MYTNAHASERRLKNPRKPKRRTTDPYKDGVFLSAVELWYRLREDGVRLSAEPRRLPDHSRHIFCAFMYVCFRGDTTALYQYMAGDTHRGLTIALRQARERFYKYGLDDEF
jgi:hypothetical protein